MTRYFCDFCDKQIENWSHVIKNKSLPKERYYAQVKVYKQRDNYPAANDDLVECCIDCAITLATTGELEKDVRGKPPKAQEPAQKPASTHRMNAPAILPPDGRCA